MEQFQEFQKEETVDFKALLFKFLHYWYYFAIAIMIALGSAYVFNRYAEPVYKVSCTVLVKDDKNPASSLLQNSDLFSPKKNIQNEIGVLKSFTLAQRTVREMNLTITYFGEGRFRYKELYNSSPFTVVFDSAFPQLVNVPVNIRIHSKDKYSIEFGQVETAWLYNFREDKVVDQFSLKKKVTKTLFFGEVYQNKYFSFKIILSKNYVQGTSEQRRYKFYLNTEDQLTGQMWGVAVEPINREASLLAITYKNQNPGKAIDYVNKLADVYINRDLEEKNQKASNTIRFIDSQLIEITDSLGNAEDKLQDFRTENRIMDVSAEASTVFQKVNELEKQRAMERLKGKYFKYLLDYIRKNRELKDEIVAPSAMGIEDPILATLVNSLNLLIVEKAQISISSTAKNPYLDAMNQKISRASDALLQNVQNIVNMSNIGLQDIDNRIGQIEAEVNKLPGTERKLINIKRKFDINNRIYTYLLEKRAEAAIAKASTISDNKVIDYARGASLVYPKKSLNYAIALLIALIIPILIIYLRDYMNDKIIEKKDVEHLTNIPIVGHVVHSDKDTQLVVFNHPKSSIAESFRSVRTNLQYMAKGKEKFTILVTSTMVSEGKTFSSMNLASIYALYGK